MQEQMCIVSRELEILRMKQKNVRNKNTVTEINNGVDGLIC